MPTQKLEQLQAILQSEFLKAVREVYEHVYETVDITGSPEIAANATAKVNITFDYGCFSCADVLCSGQELLLHLNLIV